MPEIVTCTKCGNREIITKDDGPEVYRATFTDKPIHTSPSRTIRVSAR